MATTIELSPHELHGLCQRSLKDPHLRNTTLQVLHYSLKPTSDAPAGFLGRHLFLTVKIRTEDANGAERIEKLRFFTKSAPVGIASRMEYIEEFGVFKKEILVYRELLPQLQGIFPDVAPKCYYADNRLLVFENLAEQGYRMAAGRDGILNYEHLNCALKTLAAMHAGSIVHEVRRGEKLTQMCPQAVVENAYPCDSNEQHVRRQNFNNANRAIVEILKLMPKYQANLPRIIEEFPKRMSAIFELAKVSTKYQNVFSHGDLWANNVMFLYGKFGESPIQCRFVDFQLGRYAPPMIDLVTLLTIPTSRQFRAEHMALLLNNYYHYMSEFLKSQGLRLDDYLPRYQFDEGVEEFRICGLIESLLFSHLTILPQELTQALTTSTDGFSDFFDRKRTEICLQAFQIDRTYRERLTDMIEDFVDNFVLK